VTSHAPATAHVGEAGELVRREHARGLGTEVVVAVFRLVKLTQVHDTGNQAINRQIEDVARLVHDYGLYAGGDLNVLFARRAVFLAGQLLRASRAEYESANELGELLERLGGSELTIARDVTVDDLHAFAEAISRSRPRPGEAGDAPPAALRGAAFHSPTPRIRLRPVADAARVRGLEVEKLDFEQRLVRTYASAVVVLRRFFEQLAVADYSAPRRLKRIAQSLVDLSAGPAMAFLGVTEARNANFDAAGRAVNTAILAVAMAREVCSDRATLAQVAMAAMMHDAGRARTAAAGAAGTGLSMVSAQLTDAQEDELPAGTAVVLTALGRFNDATRTRTVVAYESLWLRRGGRLGAIYGGVRRPSLHARIIAVARRYNDLLTPEPGLAPPTPDFGVATLHAELAESADRTVLRMLVSALGLYPVGTIVRLSSGEIGEVTSGSQGRAAPDRPRVRVVMDATGCVLDQPVAIDLSAPAPGAPERRILAVVSIDGWRKGLDPQRVDRPASDAPSGVSASGVSVPSLSAPSFPSFSAVREAATTQEAPTAPPPPMPEPTPLAPAQAERTLMHASPFDAAAERAATERTSNVPTLTPRARAVEPSEGPPSAATRKVLVRTRDPLDDPTATARGSFASTPLVHVLVYILDRCLSGTVVIREPDGAESTVYFESGRPAKVRTTRPVALIGEILVSRNALSADDFARALETSRHVGNLVGEQLLTRGFVQRDVLEAALTAQVIDKLVALVNAPPETRYAFYRDVNTLRHWPTIESFPTHPLDAILACSRAWLDRTRIHTTLSRMTKQPLDLSPAAQIDAMELTPDERPIVETMRREKTSLARLRRSATVDDETIASLVYAFAVTRQFSFLEPKGLPMGIPGGAPSGAGDRISLVSAMMAAPSVAAPARPTPMPTPPTESQPPESQAPATQPLPRASSEAHREVAVAAPPQTPRSNAAESPDDEAERALQAMEDLRLAEASLARGDTATALRLAVKAAAGDPDNTDPRALVAWIEALGGQSQPVADALEDLGRILEGDPSHERSLLYRGRILKRMGKLRAAAADFTTLLQANPRNKEAASELRLIQTKMK
jgi:hypothetical protein